MATFNELLRPAKFDAEPNSPDAGKKFKHWFKTLENVILGQAQEVEAVNKLRLLCTYVSADVYEMIEDCESYDVAIEKLRGIYVKSPNVVFARHLLATRKQKPGESLQDFLQSLHSLSKDCNLRNVTAEEYRRELVRDAFINGLSSHHIRQRLSENAELSIDQAYRSAMSLQLAQEHSSAYFSESKLSAAVTQDRTNSSEGETEEESVKVSARLQSKKCYFCGQSYHLRKNCPALDATCYLCGKNGHFSRVCQSKRLRNNAKKSKSQSPSQSAALTPSLCVTTAACPGSLLKSSLSIKVNDKHLTALIDSGSSESYINSKVCRNLQLEIYPSESEIQMASSAVKTKSSGFCLVDVVIKDTAYESTRLNVLENLCSDVILGLDFQSQHQRLIFEFDGTSPDMIVSNKSNCAVAAASTEAVSLFSNLSPGAKPIATKSRRFNKEDQEFIQETIDKWSEEGVIQPSSSPWRAQVVVVKDDLNRHRKRLCVDYSQTINLYTELDAYPLPRIDDMINNLSQYSIFSTFDLRSAYHQIELLKTERKYTAFEANGNLYEFTRVPFGVKNGVAVFQRQITKFINEENLKDTFAYLDNVTVAGRTQLEHDINVKAFSEAIIRRKFTLNDNKTVKSVPNVNILGYIVGNMCIKPDPERMRPLIDFPPPSNLKALRRVLG